MPDERIFVDTNILVYAHDLDAGARHDIALTKVKALWGQSIRPSISVQVLQECYVNFLRKKFTPSEARDIVTNYMYWDLIPNDANLMTAGMGGVERWKISLWDALILAAAKRAGATVLWSEDLTEGQDYDGVMVVNPLRPEA